MRDSKTYTLNHDFAIVCTTEVRDDGSKFYSIEVEMISLPFFCILEEYRGLTNPKKANEIFKELRVKYKEGIGYAGNYL